MLERRSRHMVAFVGDHQPVPRGESWDVGTAGQGLQGDDVDDPFDFRPAAAGLAWLLPGFITSSLTLTTGLGW